MLNQGIISTTVVSEGACITIIQDKQLPFAFAPGDHMVLSTPSGSPLSFEIISAATDQIVARERGAGAIVTLTPTTRQEFLSEIKIGLGMARQDWVIRSVD